LEYLPAGIMLMLGIAGCVVAGVLIMVITSTVSRYFRC